MAGTLKVKIQEDIILDNQDYGSKRVLEVGSIASIVKRIVNIGTDEIGLLGFGTAYNTELSKSYLAGQFDENNDEFGVKVDKGCSFLYCADLAGGVADTMDSADAAGITPNSFGDLVDITCAADTSACDVEVFVAST
jgi:hypothetical protein